VTTRCLVCSNEALKTYVDGALDKGMSARGIAAGLTAAGGSIDPDVISRHRKNHYTPPKDPSAPQPTKRDLAITLRDRVLNAIDELPEPGEDELDPILSKHLAPALGAGLKAQALIDKREANAEKLGLAKGYLGLQLYLQGLGHEPQEPVMLDDGNTLEGEYAEVD